MVLGDFRDQEEGYHTTHSPHQGFRLTADMLKSGTSLGSYLFRRLRQLGVGHIYGVPGDYTLRALDQLNGSGIRFVGCCNELNAGYAADGYARARRWRPKASGSAGLGAVFTTYGVGELSAANAIACSYAEHVPVVHLVGTPGKRTLQMSAASGLPDRSHIHIHHSLNNGRAGAFREIAERFTVAQLNLADVNAKNGSEKIEEVLSEALRQSRPVYIELPADQTAMEIDSTLERSGESNATPDPKTINSAADSVLERLYNSKRPMILVDRGQGVEEFRNDINRLVEVTGLPTLAMPSGMGMVDGQLKNYFGVHSGKIGLIDTSNFVSSADLVLAFGPMFSDTQTLSWDTVPAREKMVIINKNSIDDTQVDSRLVLQTLTKKLDVSRVAKQDTSSLGDYRLLGQPQSSPSDNVNQADFYHVLSPHLRENDTILLANATPIIGGRDLVLPPSSQLIASGMAFSIGHMLPAALGAAQAQDGNPTGRVILLDGDGSFQVTAQELSTIIHQRVNMTIFIINNQGYTYERFIHGEHEEYNDIAPWDYLAAPSFFGKAPEGYPVATHRVRTWKDLDVVLNSEEFRAGIGLTLVDVEMGKLDISPRAKSIFEEAGKHA